MIAPAVRPNGTAGMTDTEHEALSRKVAEANERSRNTSGK